MDLRLAALASAVVTSAVLTPRWRGGGRGGGARCRGEAVHTTLLVRARRGDAWKEFVRHALASASKPGGVRVRVLAECADDDTSWTALDADLRTAVRVDRVALARTPHTVAAVRRLVRRLHTGDERCAVAVHVRARFVQDWDATLHALLPHVPAGAILSAPTAAADGAARFPTLRVRSTGAVARSDARSFSGGGGVATVPAVCWCAECVVVPADLDRLGGSTTTTTVAADEAACVVPAVPLLRADETLDDLVLDEDDGCDAPDALTAHERVGLTRRASDDEKILKFGSVLAAKLEASQTSS